MRNLVTIGIQARSRSKRFPKKIFEKIGDRSVLEHVIDACSNAAQYINNWGTKKTFVEVVLCVPYNDPISEKKWGEADLVDGPEDDVLKRYTMMAKERNSDYIVRVTADCPLIVPALISKSITISVMNNYDYFSNVEEECRTSADGMDCEVISRHALIYADLNAVTPYDREHVTPFIRRDKGKFKQGDMVGFFDFCDWKVSLDEPRDLDRIRQEYEKVERKYKKAVSIFGERHVHRF